MPSRLAPLSPQIQKTRVFSELAQLVDRVEHPADVVVGVLRVAGVGLHLAGVERLQFVRHVLPGGERLVALGQLSIRGDHSKLLLPGEGLPRSLSQPWSNLPLYRRPFLGHVMRRVAAARGEVGEERLGRVLRPDPVQPLDRLVRHVVGQVVGVLVVVVVKGLGVPMIFWFSARHGSHWPDPPPRKP